jgi:hypothetical protein
VGAPRRVRAAGDRRVANFSSIVHARRTIDTVAHLHKTTLVPSKLELLAAWAPKQPWFAGDAAGDFANLASFRLDDPDGEVGIETLFVRAGDGPVLQFPLTYRNDAVEGAEHFLIGTLQHGVLGKRWVYDAVGDPVYLSTLARMALAGGPQAELFYEVDGVRTYKEPNAVASGSGSAGTPVPNAHDDHVPATRNDLSSTLVETDHLTVLVARLPVAHPLSEDTNAESVTATWTDQPQPAILALVSPRG